MITAYDLYALTQESQTACYLLPELCEVTNNRIEDVKAPEPKRDESYNPFTESLQ